MRLTRAALAFLAGALTWTGAATAAAHAGNYVGLTAWAKTNGLHVRWTRPQEELLATNSTSRLTFTVDSRRVTIDGIVAFLSFPVQLKGANAYVAAVDLERTLQPVLSPPRNLRGSPLTTICLDPGHGGRDPGNQAGHQQEKDYTLALALEVRKLLTAAGLKVMLTRQTDAFVPLPERPDLAKRRDADLFVSLHFNTVASGRDDVHGVEVYCLTPAGARSTYAGGENADTERQPGNKFDAKNMLLAHQLQKSMVQLLPAEDRGVKRARFAVLRTAAMPAVLVEAGFMSHPAESKKVFDAAYRRRLAQAITEGILAYRRSVER